MATTMVTTDERSYDVSVCSNIKSKTQLSYLGTKLNFFKMSRLL